jgi:hypothetical protein
MKIHACVEETAREGIRAVQHKHKERHGVTAFPHYCPGKMLFQHSKPAPAVARFN